MIYISYQNSMEDRHKRIKRGKEEFTPPLFPDNTILYLDDPVEPIGKLWDLIHTYGLQIQNQ